MDSASGDRDLGSALMNWDRKRDVDALIALAQAIPATFISTDLSKLLKALVVFLSQCSEGLVWDNASLVTHLSCMDGVYFILQNLNNTKHNSKDDASITRSLVANMDRLCRMLSIAIENISSLITAKGCSTSEVNAGSVIYAALDIVFILVGWGHTTTETPISTSFRKNRYTSRVMTSVWALNIETNALARPGEPPNFINAKGGQLPLCHLLEGMRLYLMAPNVRKNFLRTWIDRCNDVSLYGGPADPASLLATSIRARLEVLEARMRRSKFNDHDFIDFNGVIAILHTLAEDNTLKDFPTLAPATWKSGALRALLQTGLRVNAALLETAPDFRGWDPASPVHVRDFPVPLGVLKFVASIRADWKPAVNDHVRSVCQDVADGWVEILVDALVALPLLLPGRGGSSEEYVRVQMEALLTAGVSYPSVLYAVEKALKGITGERAERAARVRLKGAPLRAPYIFVYFQEEISRHARDHREFLQRHSRGDPQTVVCDHTLHGLSIQRRNLQGHPKMKSQGCSDCHVELYCSPDCQRGHWDDIHATQCSRFKYSRAAATRACSWYRSSYRIWHLYLQSLVADVALAAGPWHITILDYTQAHHLAPTVYPIATYPYADLGSSARDPRFLFASPGFTEPSADALLPHMLRSAGPMSWPWLRRPGMNPNEKPIVRLIEGVYPWKEQAGRDGACVLVMGQYLIAPSNSPERDWDIELVTSMVRISYGRGSRKARKKPDLDMADLD